MVASETCALDLLGARYVRDVEPGEVLESSGKADMTSYFPFTRTREAACIFEYFYFARPDSSGLGRNFAAVRKKA